MNIAASSPTHLQEKLTLKQWVILILVGFAFLLPGINTLPVTDRDEARYAQASKQMNETGDYVDIRFQEQTRYVKPVGTYWLQSQTAKFIAYITNEKEAKIWAYRIPSFLAGLTAILITAWIGTIMAGSKAGFYSGLIMASILIVSIESRIAKTDALLLAATAIAQSGLFLIWRAKESIKQKFIGAPLLFWAGTAAGILIKGPIILLVSIGTILSLSIINKSWSWIKHLSIFKGLALLALLVAPWLIMIIIKTEGKFLSDSLGHAMLGKVARSDDSHGLPPGMHLIFYFACFWPLGLMTALQNIYALKNRKTEVVQFLLCWIWPTWIVFELVVTKLPHYTLPLYPAIAILTSLALINANELLKDKLTKRLHWLFLVIFTLFTSLLSLFPIILEIQFALPLSTSALLTAIFGFFVIGTGLYFGIAPSEKRFVPLLITTLSFYIVTFSSTLPQIKMVWPSQQIAKTVQTLKGCPSINAAIAGYPEPSNVFYLGTRTNLTTGQGAAKFLANNRDCGLAIIEKKQEEKFLKQAQAKQLDLKIINEVSGINVSKGKKIKLKIYKNKSSKITK